MPTKPPAAETESETTEPRSTRRVFPFVARLPFLRPGPDEATLYAAWCLAFYILSIFRPFTGMAMLAAIVIVPLSIAAFVKPEAANDMPFWAFILMTFGFAGSPPDRGSSLTGSPHQAWKIRPRGIVEVSTADKSGGELGSLPLVSRAIFRRSHYPETGESYGIH